MYLHTLQIYPVARPAVSGLMSMILGCWHFRTCVNKYEFPTNVGENDVGMQQNFNQVSVLLNHQSVRFTMSGMPM